jgi:hypothetical protein
MSSTTINNSAAHVIADVVDDVMNKKDVVVLPTKPVNKRESS